MAGIFTIKVQTEFSAAHALRGYVGDCARIHGHNWKIQAEVSAQALDNMGIGVDFKDLKAALKEVTNILDHQYINEISPFDTINPTAENMVAWMFEKLKVMINNDTLTLRALTLWENERSSVRYSEN